MEDSLGLGRVAREDLREVDLAALGEAQVVLDLGQVAPPVDVAREPRARIEVFDRRQARSHRRKLL